MDKIKFAVCDDEPLMAKAIERHLADFMREHPRTAYSVSSFSDGDALVKAAGGFDVIFLDIRMERPDGMETARRLRRRGDRSLIVFVTALKEPVFDAFEVEAADYLLKPLDDTRFRGTMERILRCLKSRAGANIVIRRGTGCEVVPLGRIVYCEVLGRKIYLHKNDGTVSDYYEKFEDLARRVDGRFFKCHRSYLVNLDYVRGYRDGQVSLSSEERIPVSCLRERELTAALLRHMAEREA